MVKSLGILVGLIFIAVGIVGFIPRATPNEILFRTFQVDVIHNVAHVVIGIIFVFCGLGGRRSSRVSFQVFGIIYAVLGIWGLVVTPQHILWIIFNSRPEAWIRILLGGIFLLVGFATSRDQPGA